MNIPALIHRFYRVICSVENLSTGFKLLAFFAMFIEPLFLFIQVLILFLFIDMTTSVYLQYKRRKKRYLSLIRKKLPGQCIQLLWRTIKPEKIIQTVEKIVFYSIALIIAFILDYFLLRQEGLDSKGLLPLVSTTNAVFFIFLGAEAWSIFRNMGRITNNMVFNQVAKLIGNKTGFEPEEEKQSNI
jgi:hypothetical protein